MTQTGLAMAAAVLGMAVLDPDPVAAQAFGRVVDATTTVPIAEAGITLLDGDGEVRSQGITDAEGRFAIEAPEGVPLRIEVTALGYVTSTTDLQEMTSSDFFEIRLAPAPLEMEGLEITVERRDRFLELNGFYRRSRQGFGRMLGPEDIERIVAIESAEIFRRIPGMTTSRGEPVFIRSRFGGDLGRSCRVPAVIVDGVLMRSRFNPRPFAEIVPPVTLIAAVETYFGPASVPPQFGIPGSACGVIVVWTER